MKKPRNPDDQEDTVSLRIARNIALSNARLREENALLKSEIKGMKTCMRILAAKDRLELQELNALIREELASRVKTPVNIAGIVCSEGRGE